MFFDSPLKKYLILDIEGNSASKEEERKITQFSALLIENNEIKEINLLNRNVNYISSFASHLTHISLKKCKVNGVSERHLINEIHKLLENCDIVYAYGCDFDKRIIRYMFNKYKLNDVNIHWVDLIDEVKSKLNPSRAKLSIAAKENGFESDNFHNALTDCYAIYHLMKKIEEKEGVMVD